MRMKMAFVVAAVAGLALGVASLAGASGGNFKAQTLCNVEIVNPDDDVKDKQCYAGDPWGTVFVAKRKPDVTYTLCVKAPGDNKGCYDQRTGDAGEPHFFKAYKKIPPAVGTYKLKFEVEGKGVVKKRTFELLEEPTG